MSCVSHILNLMVQAAMKSFVIPIIASPKVEEGDISMTLENHDIGEDKDLALNFMIHDIDDTSPKF